MDQKILDRYRSEEGAHSYRSKFKKHWNERINDRHEQNLVAALLKSASQGKKFSSALDAPCGWGRLYPLVREVSERVVEGDVSQAMLDQAQIYHQTLDGLGQADDYVVCDAIKTDFPDRHFDLILSVRLSHHIREKSERLAYLRELLRVSNDSVLFTYFGENSLKNRLREFRRKFSNKRSKWTLSTEDIKKTTAECGYEVISQTPLSRLFSGHVYALLKRIP